MTRSPVGEELSYDDVRFKDETLICYDIRKAPHGLTMQARIILVIDHGGKRYRADRVVNIRCRPERKKGA